MLKANLIGCTGRFLQFKHNYQAITCLVTYSGKA